MSNVQSALDKIAIRETIEDYLNFLDGQDWSGVASCFTADAQSRYNFEPDLLQGGDGVVNWLRPRLASYLGSDHALSNMHFEVDGCFAVCDSRVTASLLYVAGEERRVAVRAIRYRDKLRREGERWLIHERRHEPQWQYDVPAAPLRV
jgi:hypothetical protein